MNYALVTVQIEFMDGTSETIRDANRVRVEDGMLHLHCANGYGPMQHVGSFPLSNIRKWRKDDR